MHRRSQSRELSGNIQKLIASSGQSFCEMCGAMRGDNWQTHPSRRVVLCVKPRLTDVLHAWVICNECWEGLKGFNRDARTAKLRRNQPDVITGKH